jgi:hypothetical protein
VLGDLFFGRLEGPVTARKPAAPKGMGPRGRVLWTAVVAGYDLRKDELVVLAEACRTCDLLDQLRGGLRDAGALVPGSTGQARLNPLVPEIRAQRLALATLLRQLGLPDAPASTAAGVTSARARKAAVVRWSGRPHQLGQVEDGAGG